MSELAFKIIFLINQRKESMSVIRCDKCESIITKKDIKSNQCWKCGEVLTQKGKEWYCTECSRHNPDSLNICACGCDRLKEEESSFHGDGVEKPHNMNKTLSKEYGFLRFFQGLIGLSIFIYTLMFFISLEGVVDLAEMTDNYTLLTLTTVSYLLFLFYSICIISIVNFLFKLDERG